MLLNEFELTIKKSKFIGLLYKIDTEEDIKKIKTLKTDILSITPVLPENDSDDFSASDIKEQPFDELVKNFYRKRFEVDIGEETLALLMQIMEEN